MSFRRWQTLMTAKISRTVFDPLWSEVSAVVKVLLTASSSLPIKCEKMVATEIVSRFKLVRPAAFARLDDRSDGSYLIGKVWTSR